MPIQRRRNVGERLFGGVRDAMPFIMQYLQNREQQNAPLDLSGVAPSQPVGIAGGVASEYDTPFVRNLLSQMGGQPQGPDPNAVLQSLSQQPEPAKPLAGNAGLLQYLLETNKPAYDAMIKKLTHIAPLKTPKDEAPETPEEAGRKLITKRLAQTKEIGKIDTKTGEISESKVPFGIPEAVAAGDSLRNYLETGSFTGQPQTQQGQGLGGATTYDEFLQWYNSPAGKAHARRELYLQEAKKQFGVQ